MSFDSLFIKRSLYLCDVGEPILYANSISGSINEVSDSDKSIWLYDRATGDLLSNCILDRNTRNWKIYTDKNHDPESMFIICRDEGGEYNGDIYDRVSLCTTEYTLPEGISSTLYWPMEHLIYTEAYPRYLHEYYNVEVPNLKGDITKVVQGTEDNKVKFVDALGNTVQNDVTANNILINDNSVVLNSTVKNSYLKKWTPNVLGDDSEVFLSEYKNGIWCNHYDNTPISGKVVPKSGYDLCLGKFEEPAIYFGFYAGSTHTSTGMYCNISLSNTDAVSFSAWINSMATWNYSPNSTYDPKNYVDFSVIALRSSLDYATGFFTGIIGPTYALKNTYDNAIKTTYNISGYTTTTVTDSMYGGEEFRWSKGWHHVVVTRTATTVKTYIDGFLIRETTFASSPIPNELYISLGNTLNNAAYNNLSSGIASGVRVFNKELTQNDINILKNDKPHIEYDVVSIKGMECAKNLLYLGGIPYNHIDTYYTGTYKETTDGITNVVKTSTLSAEDALNKIRSSTPILLKDSIYIDKYYRSSSYYTQSAYGLSTSYKLATDSEYVEGTIDFDTSDLEIYIRFRYQKFSESYYILHIGNRQKHITIYRIGSSDIFQLYFNKTAVCSIALRNYDYDNTWLKLKANPTGMSLFTDDDELIGSSSTNTVMPQITSGHICVGDYRSGSTVVNEYISDVYTGSIAVSDIKLTKYSTTIDPLVAEEVYKEYKFGYERDGLAGLHLLDKNNKQIIRNFDNSNDVITYFNSLYPMLPNFLRMTSPGDDSVENILTNEKGFTVTLYYKQMRDNLLLFNNSTPYNSYSYKLGDAVYYRNCDGNGDISPSIKIGTSPNNTPTGKRLTMLSTLDMWHSCMFAYHNDSGYSEAYADGTYNESYYGRLRTDNDTFLHVDSGYTGSSTNTNASTGCVDKLKIYKTAFPMQLSRNLHQNYQEKVYKNDMQVAFIDQKYSFPLFKGIPVNSITVEGEVNGQTLTFAVTKDNNDYYICDTSWKKILTKDGDTWKYWNGSAWVAGEQEKWKAMAAAMEVTANKMSLSKINSLNATQLAEFYDGTGTVFNFAVGMKSNGTKSPYIDGILINGCKLWVSPEINLSDFSSTSYITKAHFKCVVSEGQTNGITLYSHVSGAAGWKKVDNFSHIPDINQNVANNGTVQFMFMFDQSKQNGKEPTALSVTIK